ncbi:chromate resistance protein ChrB domain-containing protein [Desertivirga brevis]|uniref:chromate resistance protein ChrB domain-containing protein n=1 Tax=Desertivirga brevis TaxID=2810310 RepID=UPI001A97AE8B|nr:chromate resistance protein ChrB domain-containing protein [Pedobacter sp. SYSU D00873]
MKWITRERPKIDRIACPWLIKNFIDPEAEFIYVPFTDVKRLASELDAIPFDVPDVEYTHYEEECTFDYLIKKYKIKDPNIHTLARIVRGADTDRHDFAPQAAGLWAISAGLAYNIQNDHELLEAGMLLYDALYSWAKHLQNVKHTESKNEQLLLQVYNKLLEEGYGKGRKTPKWVKEIKDAIQDQIDTNLSLSLSDISRELNIHPAYLSREFSKHFDNLSFGDYIRKMRIEKAIEYLKGSDYSLTEIAYLTGFSDQSHFNRIFKKHTRKTPAAFKKDLKK